MNKTKIIVSIALLACLCVATYAQTRIRRSTGEISVEKNGTVRIRSSAKGTASLNYTALAANSCEVFQITALGAAAGDYVFLSLPDALIDVFVIKIGIFDSS